MILSSSVIVNLFIINSFCFCFFNRLGRFFLCTHTLVHACVLDSRLNAPHFIVYTYMYILGLGTYLRDNSNARNNKSFSYHGFKGLKNENAVFNITNRYIAFTIYHFFASFIQSTVQIKI